jgi:hypothetical protein
MVVVAIGFAEALSAPEVIWSLVDAGFKVIAFSRKGRRAALRQSHHVAIFELRRRRRTVRPRFRSLPPFLIRSMLGT